MKQTNNPNDLINMILNGGEEKLPFSDDGICPFDGGCDECPYEKECAEDLFGEKVAEYLMGDKCCDDCEDCDLLCGESGSDLCQWYIPGIERVIFNDPATIVFWADGTKTVVRCMKGERFEQYAGFIAACAKKAFGSTSNAKAVMKAFAVDQAKKREAPKPYAEQLEMFGNNVPLTPMDQTIQEAVNEALDK